MNKTTVRELAEQACALLDSFPALDTTGLSLSFGRASLHVTHDSFVEVFAGNTCRAVVSGEHVRRSLEFDRLEVFALEKIAPAGPELELVGGES